MTDRVENTSPAQGLGRSRRLFIGATVLLLIALTLQWLEPPLAFPAACLGLGLLLAWTAVDLRRLRQILAATETRQSQLAGSLQAADAAQTKATAALFENEAQMRAFFDQPSAGIAIGEPKRDGGLIYVNDRLCEMLGYTRQDLIGKSLRDLTHPEDDGAAAQKLEAALAADLPAYTIEKRYLRANGEALWVNVSVAVIRNSHNEPTCFFILAVDISERKRAEQASRAAWAELQAIYDTAPVGLCVIDAEMRWTRINPRLAQINGFPPEDYIGKRIGELLPQIAAIVEPVYRRVLATGEPVLDFEISGEMPASPGRRRVWVMDSWPRREEGGAIVAINVVLHEVTREHETIKALAESEERYRLFFENASIGAAEMSPDGRFRRVNDTLCKITGYGAEELLAMSPIELSHPEDRRAAATGLATFMSGEPGEYSAINRYIRKDGAIIWAQCSARILRDEAGQLVRSILIVEDVSQRKQAELALRASEEKFRGAVANAAIGFAMIDLEGGIFDANAAFCRLVGYDLDELRSVHLDQLVHPDDFGENQRHYALLFADEIPSFVIEGRYCRKDGGIVWARKSVSINCDAAGRPKWAIALVEDITERRRAEQALRQINLELENRVQSEVQIREDAQARLAEAEKLAALGQLAGGVAHDFNNILQAVIGAVGLIKRRSDDAELVKKFAQMIEDSSLRGAGVTRRLLALARRDDLHAEPIEVAPLMMSLPELLRPILGDSVKIRISAAKNLPRALADVSQLETMLLNLASNGRDAMHGAGLLTIAADRETVGDGRQDDACPCADLTPGDYIRLSVTDTGCGMDKATLKRAVEPFFTTKAPGKGTGLGLSMARGFAEQSGGALHLSSEIDRGTTVTCWLPALSPAPSQDPAPQEAPPVEEGAPPPQRRRLLVVDDEASVRDVLASQLAERGYDIVQADGGEAALALLEAGEAVDLIVSDFSMPGLNGVALIQAARRLSPHLPALLLTGYAGVAATLATGAADDDAIPLLRKPVNGKELADRVAALLRSAATV